MKTFSRREFLALSAFGTASLAVSVKNLPPGFENFPINQEIFHFKIGKFKCISFNTGYYDYPVKSFFDNVPLEELQYELGLSSIPEKITSTYASLLIDTGKHRVLIDCGIGTFLEGPDLLQKYLRQEGISNDSIDAIIITHAHPDHYGGILNDEGKLNFPNARYYSNKAEWDFFLNDKAFEKFKLDNAGFVNRLAPPTQRLYEAIKNKMEYVESGDPIVPGIKVIDAKGHTPGQLTVIVSSRKESLISITDTVFHPLHLKHPDWLPHPRYMVYPVAYKMTIKRIVGRAADKNMMVSAMHFQPAPSLGHVKRNGDEFEWIPLTLGGI